MGTKQGEHSNDGPAERHVVGSSLQVRPRLRPLALCARERGSWCIHFDCAVVHDQIDWGLARLLQVGTVSIYIESHPCGLHTASLENFGNLLSGVLHEPQEVLLALSLLEAMATGAGSPGSDFLPHVYTERAKPSLLVCAIHLKA